MILYHLTIRTSKNYKINHKKVSRKKSIKGLNFTIYFGETLFYRFLDVEVNCPE